MYLSIQGIYAGTPLALRATSSRPRGYFDGLLRISPIFSGQAPVLIDLLRCVHENGLGPRTPPLLVRHTQLPLVQAADHTLSLFSWHRKEYVAATYCRTSPQEGHEPLDFFLG